MGSSSTVRLAPLTGLRFLAALHVVLFHFRDLLLVGVPSWAYEIANKGYVSVGLFFVLSGFILVHAYLGPETGGSVDRRAFWVARFARIYPLYFLSLLIAAPVITSAMQDGSFPAPGGSLLAGVTIATLGQVWTLLPAQTLGWPSWPFAVATLDWNFPTWSLGAEVFFYALFPFVAPPLARARRPVLLVLLMGCWVLAMAPPLMYAAIPGASYPADHAVAAWNWVINYTPIFRLPEFLFGMVLGLLYARSAPRAAHVTRVTAVWTVALPVAALAVLTWCFIAIVDKPGLLLANGLFDPLFGAMIYALAASDRGLAWVLARRPVVLLGEASYALYLLHVPLWTALCEAAHRVLGPSFDADTRLFFACFFVTTLGISIAAFLLWERPMRTFLRSLLQARPSRPVRLRTEALPVQSTIR